MPNYFFLYSYSRIRLYFGYTGNILKWHFTVNYPVNTEKCVYGNLVIKRFCWTGLYLQENGVHSIDPGLGLVSDIVYRHLSDQWTIIIDDNWELQFKIPKETAFS